jgi:hypothetical protein
VLPYLEEQFFGHEEQRADFELATLRAAITETPAKPPDAPVVDRQEDATSPMTSGDAAAD